MTGWRRHLPVAALAVAAVVFLILSITGFSGNRIVFLSEKTNWHAGIERLAQAAARSSGLPVTLVEVASSDKYAAYLQTSVASDNAPAFFTWWNGYQLKDLVDADIPADLSEYWDRAQTNGDFTADQRRLVSVEGKPYALLLNAAHWTVLYNVAAFKKAGIAAPPESWAELIAACEKLKTAGYTPFNATSSEGWTPFIWFSQLLVATDPDAHERLTRGEIPYTGPEVRRVFEIWLDMYRKGYFTDAREPDPYRNFASRQTGMFLIGDWAVGNLAGKNMVAGRDYRSFLMPPVDPSVERAVIVEAAPIVVSKRALAANSKLGDAVVTLMSSGASNELSATMGLYNGNLRAEKPNAIIAANMAMIAKQKPRVMLRWWESGPPDIQGDLVAILGGFMIEPTAQSAERAMRDMQQINAAYWRARSAAR